VAITDAFEPWPAETQAGYGGNLVRAVRDGWSVRTSAVYETLQRAAGVAMSQAAVVHHLAGRGIHKHKTRADGQHFVGLRVQRPRADGAAADNSDGPRPFSLDARAEAKANRL
jgi:hypothetical protein